MKRSKLVRKTESVDLHVFPVWISVLLPLDNLRFCRESEAVWLLHGLGHLSKRHGHLSWLLHHLLLLLHHILHLDILDHVLVHHRLSCLAGILLELLQRLSSSHLLELCCLHSSTLIHIHSSIE